MNRAKLQVCGLLVVLAGTAAGGCEVPSSTNNDVILWEASVQPLGGTAGAPTPVSGQAAAISRPRNTEVSLAVAVVPQGMVLRWGVFTGDCAGPGEFLGAERNYPTLSGATLSGEGIIGYRLESGSAYHVAVLDDASGQRMACGNLIAPGSD